MTTTLSWLLLRLIVVFVVIFPISAERSWGSSEQTETAAGFDHTHATWSQLLQQFTVSSGSETTVNYGKLKSDVKVLNSYLHRLENVSKAEFDQFSKDQQLAFLINAYNGFTVQLVVKHYPIKSIKDIGTFFQSPWKKSFFSLLGKPRNLDEIEHDIIRKWFDETKIHFALVCAAKGCPALRREAYVGERLSQQLEDDANAFLLNSSKNRYNRLSKQLELSSIFKWYGTDFEKTFGSLEAFLAPRMTAIPDDQKAIKEKVVSISYLEYDWSLNDEK